MYTVYSKDNCVFCERAKRLLESRRLEYVEVKLGRDMLIEDFKTRYPDQRTAPLILKDGVKIGGYADLEKYLEVNFTVTPTMQTNRE